MYIRARAIVACSLGAFVLAGCVATAEDDEVGSTEEAVGTTSTPGVAVWQRVMPGYGDQRANDVATDAHGREYVVGWYNGAISLGTDDHTNASAAGFVTKRDASGTALWGRFIESSTYVLSEHCATDAAESVFVTSLFQNDVQAGGASFTARYGTEAYGELVAKYDTNGAWLWGTTFDASNGVTVFDTATTKSGHLLVGGGYGGTLLTSDGLELTQRSGRRAAVLLEYDGAGQVVWSKQFDSTQDVAVHGVGSDSAGNLYVGGDFTGAVDFGSGVVTSQGQRDVFIVKYDATHTVKWTKVFANVDDIVVTAMAVSPGGRIALAGRFDGTVAFGDGSSTATGFDAYVVKLATDGSTQWHKRFNLSADDGAVLGIGLDSYGNVDVTGAFTGTIRIGGVDLGAEGQRDMFLAKLSPTTGSTSWRKQYSSSSDGFREVMPHALAVTPSDRILVTGAWTGTTTFGKGPITTVDGATGYHDAFLTRFYP
jgi:hypothetical protein